jgi:hypothetical protein
MKTPEEMADIAEEWATNWERDLDDSDTILKQTHKAAAPQWISVNDRLPECGDNYIILKDDGVSPYTFAIAWFDRTWDFPNSSEITHWMPLPEPPKEEK